MVLAVLLLAFSLSTARAEGQIDPSAALLLRGGSPAPQKEQLEGGRYTIRAGEAKPPPPAEPKRPASTTVKVEKIVVVESTSAEVIPAEVAKPAESVGEKVRDLVLGGSLDHAETYREQVHEEDPRRNLLDIEFAPTFVYLDSSSNYWFRNYSLSAPGFKFGAHIWITPFFGIHTSMTNSLGASVYSTVDTKDRVAVDLSWFEAGFLWRRYMGVGRKAASFSLSLDFVENQIRPSTLATNRMRTKSSGVRVGIEASVPSSNSFAWQVGGTLTPRLDHSEHSPSTGLTSGTKDQTTEVGIWFGGLHTLDRANQLYWRLQETVERSQFEGTASTADPANGATPSGVTVTTGTTQFIFGYRWGN